MTNAKINRMLTTKENFPVRIIFDFQYIANIAYQGDQEYHYLLENLPSIVKLESYDDFSLNNNYIRFEINDQFLKDCVNEDLFNTSKYLSFSYDIIKDIMLERPKIKQPVKINFE